MKLVATKRLVVFASPLRGGAEPRHLAQGIRVDADDRPGVAAAQGEEQRAVAAAEQAVREVGGRVGADLAHPGLAVLAHGGEVEPAQAGLGRIDVAVEQPALAAAPVDGQLVLLGSP